MIAVTATAASTRPPGAVLERLTYVNEDTGHTLAQVAISRGGDELLTVVGALLGAQPGRACACRGGGRAIRSTAGSSRSSPTPPCCRP
jgi:exodeoxyribonuclease V alpha subunit